LSEKTTSNEKIFICKPYLYKADKHVSTDIDNCTTTFSEAKHNLEEKKKVMS
jgi:hypothetical protein